MMNWRIPREKDGSLSRKGIADVANKEKKNTAKRAATFPSASDPGRKRPDPGHKRPASDPVPAAADITPSADPVHKRLVHKSPAAAPPIGKCPAKRPAAADKFNLAI